MSTKSDADIDTLVATFNSLPRPQLAPSGAVPNTWHFSLRHVPLEPSRDVLFLVELQSYFLHAEDAIQPPVSTDPSISKSKQAELMLPLLLSAFVSAFGIKDPERVPAVAPWSWITNDRKLAQTLSEGLRRIGVREELCQVGVGSQEENVKCHEEWCKYVGALTALVESI